MTKTAFPKGLLSVFQLSLNNSCIFSFTAVLYAVVVAVAFILNAGRLMLDKIGTLLKAQYRAEKTGKIGTFLCRLAPNYMRFHLVEWSFVRRHKKEWDVGMF